MNHGLENAFGLMGKRAVITGGGSGIGFAIAKCMVEAGARVTLLGRSEQTLKSACEALKGKGDYLVFDVTETEETEKTVTKLLAAGPVDMLVNNAGIHCKKPIEEVTEAEFSAVVNVHLTGVFRLTQAFLPHMRQRRQGSVLFISSMSAYIGLPYVSAYGAAKAGVLGFARVLASEVSGDNVRVNAITPGFIETEMFRKATSGDPARQERILSRTSMHRYGKPEDIGWAAVYLCSDAANFISGTSLVVDGGMLTGF